MGWMGRMTQWKDKTAGKNAEAASLGLLAYPSLMAADILPITPPWFRWARIRSSIWS
jgi:tryptophanyl-tRNA synthetase